MNNNELKIEGKDWEIECRTETKDIKNSVFRVRDGILYFVLAAGKDPEKEIDNMKEQIAKHPMIRKAIIKAMEFSKQGKMNLERTEEELKVIIRKKCREYLDEVNQDVDYIIIDKMKGAWGKCGYKIREGNRLVSKLMFSTNMKYLPDNLMEYVIWHEVSHLIRNDHSGKFWFEVGKKFPFHRHMRTELAAFSLLIESSEKTFAGGG